MFFTTLLFFISFFVGTVQIELFVDVTMQSKWILGNTKFLILEKNIFCKLVTIRPDFSGFVQVKLYILNFYIVKIVQ